MSLQARLLDILRYMRDQHLSFGDHFTDDERAVVGTYEAWTAKDNLFHNMVWAARLIADVETFEGGDPWPQHPYDHDFEDSNRAIFDQHQHQSWDEVHTLIRDTYARAEAYLNRASEDSLRIVPEVRNQPIWRAIMGNFATHPMIHLWEYLRLHGKVDVLESLFGEAFSAQLLAVDDSGDWQGTTLYNLACIHALSGRVPQALEELGKALRLNPNLVEWSKTDPDLVSLRDEPAYRALYV